MSHSVASVSPHAGTVRAMFPEWEARDVPPVIDAARGALDAWSTRTIEDRARVLDRIRSRFLARADELAGILHEESGKPEVEAWATEIQPAVELFRYWIRNAPRFARRETIRLDPVTYPGKVGWVDRVPRGVVVAITPRNLSLAVPLRTIVPALLAGNAVIWKPSPHAPEIGSVIAEIFRDHGPPGCFQVVQGGADLGRALIDAQPDLVAFTGSTAAGREVAAHAGARLVPVRLALGGHDAAIVLDDADLERAAEGIAWAAMADAGQSCASLKRLYVDESVADAFRARIVEVVGSLRTGVDVGPLSTEEELRSVEDQVADAVDRGARVLVGGERWGDRGFGYQPTILEDAPDDAHVTREACPGPVLLWQTVAGDDEAVVRANASPFGLTASVWSTDPRRARDVAKRLRVGVATIRNHGFTAAIPHVPFSGTGDSGDGVVNGPWGFAELTRPRFTVEDRSSARRELWWFPYDEHLRGVGRAFRDLSRHRVAAVGRLLWHFFRRFH